MTASTLLHTLPNAADVALDAGPIAVAAPEPVESDPPLPRRAGVVLHPTSLPGFRALGQIGAEARAFAGRVAAMGCSIWQVLPLGPTSFGDSPYQNLSSFAGNHLLIDLDDLVADGFLTAADLADYPVVDPAQADYGLAFHHHNALLAKAARSFHQHTSAEQARAFRQFCDGQTWLDDYALYMAIKESQGGKPWTEWPPELARRDEAALTRARIQFAPVIERHQILQFLFQQQWRRLREACHAVGVSIMGDIPIFVAHDSADVWANPELFFLDERGLPYVIAGVPPDYFSETGQRWGNPLYRWDLMAADDFAWWRRRLAAVLATVDIVRVDHFRGFESYWEIPASEETAIGGKWVPGPGDALFDAFRRHFGELDIIAEDLGEITPEVEALRDRQNLPGMKVLQFILGNDQPQQLPEQFPEHSVCYTGTHDNDTTVGWYQTASEAEREAVKRHLEPDPQFIHYHFIRAAWFSKSYIAIAPMQDVLGLGSESRLNLPGRLGGNWRWRLRTGQLTEGITIDMALLSQQSGRMNTQPSEGRAAAV